MENFRKQINGFTLVELVLMMLIVSVVSLTAAPLFFSLSTYNQQVYQDEVMNTIRYARKLAVATSGSIQVIVDDHSIALKNRTEGSSCNSGTSLADIIDPVSNAAGYLRIAPNHATLVYSADWPIYFNSLGQVLSASDCTIASDPITISVDGQPTMMLYGETGFLE